MSKKNAERSTAQKLCSSGRRRSSRSSSRRPDPGIELGQPVQHPALQLRHFGSGTRSSPVKPRRRPAPTAACCAAGGTAPPAASGSPGRCAGPRWCRRTSPTAAGYRRRTWRRFFRRDRVAQRLGHLAAFFVDDEAVGQHRFKRRAAAGADSFEQRRLEPAAMLVGAFQVQIRRPRQASRFSSTKAWVEPDSNQTSRMSIDLLVLVRIMVRPQEAGRWR